MESLGGKTLRLNADGSIPDRQSVSRLAGVFARAPQLAGPRLAAETGLQVQTEHGPSGFDGPGGGDEVNMVEAGKNYGWPIIHHRETGRGSSRRCSSTRPRSRPPAARSFTATLLRSLRGRLLLRGAARREAHPRAFRSGRIPRQVASRRRSLLDGDYGRLREAMLGPDGALYVATSNRDGRGRVRGRRRPHPEDLRRNSVELAEVVGRLASAAAVSRRAAFGRDPERRGRVRRRSGR